MSTGEEGETNLQVIDRFVAAFNENDLEGVMSFFTDDAIYHNIPMAAVEGLDAIRGVIAGFSGMASKVDWIVHNQAVSEAGVVLNERLDRFLIGDTWVELPVMGTFEIRDGKIAKWRDYFDMNQFTSQMPG